MLKTIGQTTSRKPVDTATDHSNYGFLVFTQSGPEADVHKKASEHLLNTYKWLLNSNNMKGSIINTVSIRNPYITSVFYSL